MFVSRVYFVEEGAMPFPLLPMHASPAHPRLRGPPRPAPTCAYCPAFMWPLMMVLKVEAVGRTTLPRPSIPWKAACASSQCPTCEPGQTVQESQARQQ